MWSDFLDIPGRPRAIKASSLASTGAATFVMGLACTTVDAVATTARRDNLDEKRMVIISPGSVGLKINFRRG